MDQSPAADCTLVKVCDASQEGNEAVIKVVDGSGENPHDLAQQSELLNIDALNEGAGGRPGIWANVPQDVVFRFRTELFTICSTLKKVCDPSQGGHEAVKEAVMKRFGTQTMENEVQTVDWPVKEQDGLWHPNAATVGGDVGAETEEHEYKSLMDYVDGESQPLNTLRGLHERVNMPINKQVINAMLNSPNGGSIHFGIGDDGIVEEGLHLDHEQNHAMDELRKKVGSILNSFQPPVESYFAQVEPINLRNDKWELTSRWRFDIAVKPHGEGVKVDGHAYHRVGPQTVCMTEEQFAWRFMVESTSSLPKSRAKPGGGSHRKPLPLPHEESPVKEILEDGSRQSHGKSRKDQKEPSQKQSRKKDKRRQ